MSDVPVSVPDEDLYCPNCGYSLRGLVEERCPECGEAFDREELRSAWNERPVLPWSRREQIGWMGAWLATCGEVLFRPSQFVRAFPRVPRPEDVRSFGRVTRGVASLLALAAMGVGAVLGGWSGSAGEWLLYGLPLALAVAAGCLVGSYCCELALGGLFLLAPDREANPIDSVRGWSGLMHFGCVYLVLAALGAGLSVYAEASGSGWAYSALVRYWGGLVLWWWCWVGVVLFTRAGKGNRAGLLLLGTPTAVSFGLIVGGAVFGTVAVLVILVEEVLRLYA